MAYTAPDSTSSSFNSSLRFDDTSDAAERRLVQLEELNARIAADNLLYRTPLEHRDAALMAHPISSKAAFSVFGFLIGAIPPISVAVSILVGFRSSARFEILFGFLLVVASVATGMAASLTGPYVLSLVTATERRRQPNRIALIVLIGTLWGAVSGALGGLFLFIIGAFFGAFIGGVIGAITVPVFVTLHNIVRRGDQIELNHLLPIAFGIALSVCAFVLGR